MKKTILCLTMLLWITLITSSCATVVHRHHSVSARSAEPQHQQVLTMPHLADLEVIGERFSYRVVFRGITSLQEQDLENWRNIALADAVRAVNADIIVGALFETEFERGRHPRDNELRVTVIGFPAIFTNFRNATKEDAWILDFYFPERNRSVIFPPISVPTFPSQPQRILNRNNN